jgi:pyridoxal 5'-phosphate synthase pdxS subunit
MSEQNSAVGKDIPGFTAEERQTKIGLAEQLRGGVIMDVTDARPGEASPRMREPCAVMALERVPSDIRKEGGVARMSAVREDPGDPGDRQRSPSWRRSASVTSSEAQILQALEVDYIDESEVLTMADESNHIDKLAFKTPFVCGARNLGEAMRRIGEGRGAHPHQG